MFPASCKGGGQCAVPGPLDVCKTPAPPAPFAPIPYPNIAMVPQATKTSSKVKIMNMDAVTKKSEIPMSNGDNAGTIGGMVSSTFMQKVTFKKCAMKVKIEGQAAAHATSMTGHNGSNANAPPGLQVAPSQVKVIIM